MPDTLTENDIFWDDLVEYLEERRVIPIIGPELLTVKVEGRVLPLQVHIATQLANRLRIPAEDLQFPYDLNDVACAHIQRRGRREDIYPRIRSVMKEVTLEVPESLRKLARIGAFDLFVSTTFDNLLAEAINQERFNGESRTLELAYNPADVQDLPVPREGLGQPAVYHLLGRLSAAPEYVITEEDLLEFLHAMQSGTRRPHLLFDALKENHLLILGCSFPNWLARFFIRISKSRQLSSQRGEMELIVDSVTSGDTKLTAFLESFSYNTKVLNLTAIEFVDELWRHWHARHPESVADYGRESATPVSKPATAAQQAVTPAMGGGAVFISYAKEDLAAVELLKQGVEDAGIDVWFDKQRLEAGDDYDQKIRRNIRNCSLFIPVISRNAMSRVEGYFRREWRWAIDRAEGIAEGVPFIVPVVIDDTPEYNDAVPDYIGKMQWTRLADGVLSQEFRARLVQLIRDYRKRERSVA